jgi:hypothetical protein
MSLASNAFADIHKESPNTIPALTMIKDECSAFNELDCAAALSALGRYSSKDTIPTLIKFKKLVENLLTTKQS